MASRFTEEDVNKYKKFKKVDGATYRKVNAFLRKRTFITAREWALARLCTDFRTRNGAEMTFIGKNLPQLVPFMEEEYTPQAVNQARNSFKKKVRISGATFFYGAMCGFFTQEELDDLLFEASEVARFLLEVERTSLDIDEEIEVEDRITEIMRSVGKAAARILKERQNGTFTELEEKNADETAPETIPAGPDVHAGTLGNEENRDEAEEREVVVQPGEVSVQPDDAGKQPDASLVDQDTLSSDRDQVFEGSNENTAKNTLNHDLKGVSAEDTSKREPV